MTQPREEKEDSLLQALLQEYANASQLYMNTIAVTYIRFFGFLAVHGALIVGFFLAPEPEWRLLISIIGFLLAIFTFLSIEHVWQFTEFRIAQARDIEKQINERFDDGAKVITTFDRQAFLFGNKGLINTLCERGEKIMSGDLKFSHLPVEESLPRSKRAALLINIFPFHADRVTTIFLIIIWVVLIILSLWNRLPQCPNLPLFY